MNMTALKARITEALNKGVINQATAVAALKAITEPSTCGNRMSPSRRNTILTNRFGI